MSNAKTMNDDSAARLAALDGRQSFIVQAPAGSGKTELLIQRFLVLLAEVEAPEQIVAITFTRKAAAEMRERIVHQLQAAMLDLPPDAPLHRQATWQLARRVLARDQLKHWQLVEQPERLRLVTIDALCADLVRQLPLASGLMKVNLSDHPLELYEAAVQAMFDDLDDATPWQSALHCLLSHCDNRLDQLSGLCQRLLATREQWLPLMQAAAENPLRLKQLLEDNFASIAVASMQCVNDLLSEDEKVALLPCMRLAAELCVKHQGRYQIFKETLEWPAPTLENQVFWQAFGQFLLTEDRHLRKRLDVNNGFPPASKAPDAATKVAWQAHKASMQALLVGFSEQLDLLPALQNVVLAPPSTFDQAEWPLCQAIFSLFAPLLAYWRVTSTGRQQIDFAEVSWRARTALGDEQSPTDLALQLDHQVEHWLIDEFQDTSLAQFALFTRLTAGWQVGDGRSLFLVGDPLQSIYRFRQAEVSLFWQVWHQGLAGLPVKALQLTRNFRSQAGLVDWFNRELPPRFPRVANWQVGAVPYTPVTASRTFTQTPAVINGVEGSSESAQLVAWLQHELAVHETHSIAILVKARSHLRAILPALQQASIAYRAVELSALIDQPVVRDVLSLLQALLTRDDRLAWAAILRAPWGGALSLIDWQQVVGDGSRAFVWPFERAGLSEEGLRQLARIEPILQAAMQNRHRQSVCQWLDSAWCALGAAEYWSSPVACLALTKFWALLIAEEQAGDLPCLLRFERLLARTYLEETEVARVEIMTIHKAKGLEFDVVMLPGLERRQAADDTPLFVFDTLCGTAGARWLLAPMKAVGVKQEPRYDFLRNLQKTKRLHEAERLFYVASTRARERLYLL